VEHLQKKTYFRQNRALICHKKKGSFAEDIAISVNIVLIRRFSIE
jgi:hypothetical protein